MYCTVLHCTVLPFTVLDCTALYKQCTALPLGGQPRLSWHNIWVSSPSHRPIVSYPANRTLHNAVQCSAMLYSAVQYITVQCDAM